MTDFPPPEPPSRHRRPDFDEWIAIFVALTGIGTVFFWSINQKGAGIPLASLPSLFQAATPVAKPSVTPVPSAEASPAPSPAITPTPTPAPSPPPTAVAPDAAKPPIAAIASLTAPVAKATPAPSPQGTPMPAPSPVRQFSDVPADFWATPAIATLVNQGILSGFPDGSFRPNEPITRAQFAEIISKAFNKPLSRQVEPFKDVSSKYWARGAINKSFQMGFLNGYPEKVFLPDQKIPRFQLQIALATGLGLQPPANPAQVLSQYPDAAQLPSYATGKVSAAIANGLVFPHPNPQQLDPQQIATRADVATLIYQSLKQAGRVK